MTGRAIEALGQMSSHPPTTVLVGGSNPALAELKDAASGLEDVEVVSDSRDVASLMAHADLAISAAGTTTWELAAMRVPTLAVVCADNQSAAAAEMSRRGIVVVLGEAESVTSTVVAERVASLAADVGRRRALVDACRREFDGSGTERVVDYLLSESR